VQTEVSGYTIERVVSDIMVPLPETKKGNNYILVLSDYFSKWTEAFPLQNIEAVSVAEVIVKTSIARFGASETIHSDQGVQYESHLFQKVCKWLGKTRTTPIIISPMEWFNGSTKSCKTC